MSAPNFGDLLTKSFENGTIRATQLEKLLRCLVTRLDWADVGVESEKYAESSDVTQSEDESETMISTNHYKEKSSSKTVKTIHINSEDEEHSKEISMRSDSVQSPVETLEFKRALHLQELPVIKALPPCSFSCQHFGSINSVKEINLHHHLESHLKKQIDVVSSVISQNQLFQQQQICDIQNQLSDVCENIKDLFFACEQNEEKIDDSISRTCDFNAKIFCLKSDVKTLVADSKEFRAKFIEIEDDCKLKEYTSDVDEKLLTHKRILFSELESYTRLDLFNDECDRIKLGLAIYGEIFRKFEGDVKKALRCLKVQLDEKMEKGGLEKFKVMTAMLFDDFIKELKRLVFKMLENTPASGTAQNLNCMSCQSKVSAFQDLSTLEGAVSRFKFHVNRTPVPKKNLSRVRHFCRKKQVQKVNKIEAISEFTCHTKESLLSFPSTRQCFIISKDNAIFKADPLRCLKNPNYSKV
jgi:hypothetical protein